MKKYLLPFLTIILVAVLIGITFGTDLTKSSESAERNYKEYCSSCHGENLREFINRDWVYGNSWNEVYKAIAIGYPDDGMPSYDTTFTDQELSSLTTYILEGIEKMTIESFDEEKSIGGVLESEDLNFRMDTLMGGFDNFDVPWGIGFLPNGDLLVTERDGDFYRYRTGEEPHQITGVPEVRAKGQGGLMDVKVHPDFEENGFIYLSFSKPKGGEGTTAILRARLENDELLDQKLIFEAEPYVSTRHHYGSRMEFDREGYLFFTVGDRGRRDQHPQYLTNHCGKVHRVNDDGSIPADNPFVNDKSAKGSIWSYGHRNPQGLAMHPETGQIWDNEHGPRGGDEINSIRAGKNYGWPIISYGINYNGTKFTDITEKEGMEQPDYYWLPSIGVCGMTFVSGDRYPEWEGDILSGSLRFKYLHRTKMEGDKIIGHEKLLQGIGRLRDVKIGPDGYIYVAKENPGYIIRLTPEN